VSVICGLLLFAAASSSAAPLFLNSAIAFFDLDIATNCEEWHAPPSGRQPPFPPGSNFFLTPSSSCASILLSLYGLCAFTRVLAESSDE